MQAKLAVTIEIASRKLVAEFSARRTLRTGSLITTVFGDSIAPRGGTVWLGLALSRGQSTVRDYFTSGRRAPWGVVMASIVATETSTVTLVSLPGFAFGTDLTFLQLVLGYLVGRVIITGSDHSSFRRAYSAGVENAEAAREWTA